MPLAYLKNLRSDRVIFLLISIALTVSITVFCYYTDGYDEWKNYLISTSEYNKFGVGLEFYYYIQSSAQSIWFSFLIFIALTNIFSIERLINKKSGFATMMKVRVGSKKYFKNLVVLNTFFSFIYILILQFVLIVTIRILIGPFNFSEMMNIEYIDYSNIFSSSQLISLCVYILFSSIGYTLFSNLLFTFTTFIKNVYVYRGLGLILSIIFTALPAMIFINLYRLFNLNIFMDLGSLLFLPNLLNPGIQLLDSSYMLLDSPYYTFLFQCIFVIFITLFLNYIGNKKEYIYD